MKDRNRKHSTQFPLRHEPTLKKTTEKLGPMPNESLRAMTDYGLNDREIARYYGIDEGSVSRLRRVFETVRDL